MTAVLLVGFIALMLAGVPVALAMIVASLAYVMISNEDVTRPKPDPEMFHRALEVIGSLPSQAVFVDDLLENVLAARSVGITSYQFRDVFSLEVALRTDGLL